MCAQHVRAESGNDRPRTVVRDYLHRIDTAMLCGSGIDFANIGELTDVIALLLFENMATS